MDAKRVARLEAREAEIDLKLAVLEFQESLLELSLSLKLFERQLYGQTHKLEIVRGISTHSSREKSEGCCKDVQSRIPSSAQKCKVVDGDRFVEE